MGYEDRLEILGTMLARVRTERTVDGTLRIWCAEFPEVRVITSEAEYGRNGLRLLREGIEMMLWDRALQSQGHAQASM